ncbi:MAG: DUF177 domain-containing protein [Bacteroidia bacterium]|nr:DUF177 domain-containing protein [Bacteroidia bacterium]
MSGSCTIPLSGLKGGREQFEESEIKEGSLIANIEMDKRSSHLDIVLRISGSIKVCCDRCLETFFQPVKCENRLLVKFGKSIGDDDPDIISIPVDENELDLQQQIYEFIHLALPIKRVHPDDNNGESTCDPVMLKKLEEFIVEEETENDPRWNELKKLMNDN